MPSNPHPKSYQSGGDEGSFYAYGGNMIHIHFVWTALNQSPLFQPSRQISVAIPNQKVRQACEQAE